MTDKTASALNPSMSGRYLEECAADALVEGVMAAGV
jgi:hypothetical protein